MKQISDKKIIETYGIPTEFFLVIQPYLEQQKIAAQEELISVWRSAIRYAKLYPQYREGIAEWTMSVGAGSPFVQDHDLYEAVHEKFGSLEVPGPTKTQDQEWNELGKLIKLLAN